MIWTDINKRLSRIKYRGQTVPPLKTEPPSYFTTHKKPFLLRQWGIRPAKHPTRHNTLCASISQLPTMLRWGEIKFIPFLIIFNLCGEELVEEREVSLETAKSLLLWKSRVVTPCYFLFDFRVNFFLKRANVTVGCRWVVVWLLFWRTFGFKMSFGGVFFFFSFAIFRGVNWLLFSGTSFLINDFH